jgi:hypothetical protein
VVHASAWLKQGPGRGSGDSSCGREVEAGSRSMEVAGGAGVGIRWWFTPREAVWGAGIGLRRWWSR